MVYCRPRSVLFFPEGTPVTGPRIPRAVNTNAVDVRPSVRSSVRPFDRPSVGKVSRTDHVQSRRRFRRRRVLRPVLVRPSAVRRRGPAGPSVRRGGPVGPSVRRHARAGRTEAVRPKYVPTVRSRPTVFAALRFPRADYRRRRTNTLSSPPSAGNTEPNPDESRFPRFGGGAGLWSAINNGSPPTRCRVIVSNQTRRIGLRLRLDNLSDGNPAMF